MCDLETTLSLLARHGRPRLSQMDDGGWYCYVDMHVAAKGAAFKVASDFNCPGALSAADQCLDRIHAMLNSFDVNMSVNHDRGVIGMHAANQTGMAKAITHG